MFTPGGDCCDGPVRIAGNDDLVIRRRGLCSAPALRRSRSSFGRAPARHGIIIRKLPRSRQALARLPRIATPAAGVGASPAARELPELRKHFNRSTKAPSVHAISLEEPSRDSARAVPRTCTCIGTLLARLDIRSIAGVRRRRLLVCWQGRVHHVAPERARACTRCYHLRRKMAFIARFA